jgi:hypothetical protein
LDRGRITWRLAFLSAECQEAEARDRSSPVQCDDPEAHCPDIGRDVGIGLPGQQLALLKAVATQTTTPIVLVILSGSSVAVPWCVSQDYFPGPPSPVLAR